MMRSICYIVGACEPGKMLFLERNGSMVIAADGGLRYLKEQGVKADLVVGDFDSLGYVPQGEEIVRHPVEKDDTDTMLAVKLGLERGYRKFVLYGCVGGRLDHTYANLQTLVYLARHGAQGYLRGDGMVSSAICSGEIHFPAQLSGTVSVFCPDGTAQGVNLRGLYYPLSDGELTSGFPLGVSNHFTGADACVSVENGTLLVMWEETAETLMERLTEKK